MLNRYIPLVYLSCRVFVILSIQCFKLFVLLYLFRFSFVFTTIVVLVQTLKGKFESVQTIGKNLKFSEICKAFEKKDIALQCQAEFRLF